MRLCLAFLALVSATPVFAGPPTFVLTIKDHRISPLELKLPPGKKITIVVINEDPATEEFDSQVNTLDEYVKGKARVSFEIGPLKPGYYEFLGEYHPRTAKGHFKVAP